MYPISVIQTHDNRAFIVDGERWTPVAVGTSLADAQVMHRKMFPSAYLPKPKFVAPKFRTVTMKSHTRNVEYKVLVYDNGRVECNCPGFTFRRKCKHVEQVRGK
jgi:hypothetical protein